MTATVALRWAQAFGSLCIPGPVVVGGDSRISRVMMRASAFAGLSSAGCSIVDVGIVPTPTIALAVRHHRALGGIAITASHNPREWNAFKFYDRTGLFLDEAAGAHLHTIVESNTQLDKTAEQIGNYQRDDEAISRHVHSVLEIPFLDITALRQRRFRVGLDAVNGAGGLLLSTLLTELGCEIVGFHLEPTGIFPRNPEPLPENLRVTCADMKSAGVDIGFVVDPDADRLAVILENGQPAGEELTVVAATDLVLRYMKGAVVANCSTTRALDDVAVKYGSTVTRTKVGEAHVARKMHELCAVIGGEGNGGVMFPQIHAARDTAVGIAIILQVLLESGGKASDYFSSLPQYVLKKERVTFENLDLLQSALNGLEDRVPWGKVDRLDGYKWDLPQGWVQIRASNTEPIVRVFAEAREEAAAKLWIEQAKTALHNLAINRR